MPIVLTPELEKLVDEEIKTGDFASPNEVLRESLLMLKDSRLPREARRKNLGREIQKGIDAIREGHYTTYATGELDDLAEEIIERGTKKLAEKTKEK